MKKRFLSLVLAIVLLCSFAIPSFAFSDVAEKHWAKDYIDAAQKIGIINGYGDGTFKPENEVTAGEFIKMVACVMEMDYKPTFKEGEHWAYQYVEVLNKHIEGFEFYKYDEAAELDAKIPRGDMSVILALAYSSRHNIKIRYDLGDGILFIFTDLPTIKEEQKPFINLCVIYEVLNGYDDNTFKPNAVLTRAQASKVIYKLLYR